MSRIFFSPSKCLEFIHHSIIYSSDRIWARSTDSLCGSGCVMVLDTFSLRLRFCLIADGHQHPGTAACSLLDQQNNAILANSTSRPSHVINGIQKIKHSRLLCFIFPYFELLSVQNTHNRPIWTGT